MSHDPSCLTALTVVPIPANDGGAPDWLRLVPKGEFRAADGRGPWRYRDAGAVIRESFARHPRIHVDVNHSTITLGSQGGEAPAIGYVAEMEEREDGIWGRIDWTRLGREKMGDRQYWGLSPVILSNKETGDITAIAHVAVTNNPAVPDLVALQKTETAMTFLEKLAKLLGLGAEATEAAVETALQAVLKDAESADDASLQEALTRIGAALGVDNAESADALVAAATKLSAGGSITTEAMTALQTKVDALSSEVTKLTGDNKALRTEAYFESLAAQGIVVPSAKREKYIALHMADPEGFKANIEPLFQKVPLTHTGKVPPASPDMASPTQLADQISALVAKKAAEGIAIDAATALQMIQKETAA